MVEGPAPIAGRQPRRSLRVAMVARAHGGGHEVEEGPLGVAGQQAGSKRWLTTGRLRGNVGYNGVVGVQTAGGCTDIAVTCRKFPATSLQV